MDNTANGVRRFQLRRELGRGAFGVVYLAEMTSEQGFRKPVAVKILRSAFVEDREVVTRLKNEAHLLGQLRHPGIVKADDLIKLAGRLAVVMEYVDGANLSWILSHNNNPDPVPARVAVEMVRRVADALDAAWGRKSELTGAPLQVLHRDIKPSNIRVSFDGEVKVLDFGIARANSFDLNQTQSGMLMGSLPYMCPEAFEQTPSDPGADIYALGVIFFELLTRKRFGRCAVVEEYHDGLLDKRLPSIVLEGIPDETTERIRGLIRQMLAFHVEDRPTAIEVASTCRELWSSMSGTTLDGWARAHIPGIVERQQMEDSPTVMAPDGSTGSSDELLGQILTEQSTHLDEATIAIVPPPRRRRMVPIALALLLMGGVGLGILAMSNRAPIPAAAAVIPLNNAPAALAIDPIPEPLVSEPDEALEGEVEAQMADPAAILVEAATEAPVTSKPVPNKLVTSKLVTSKRRSPKQRGSTQDKRPEPSTATTTGANSDAPVAAPESSGAPTAATGPVSVGFNSKPMGVGVNVDGVFRGKTPLRVDLSPGEHVVTFEDGQSPISKTIAISPDGRDFWQYVASEKRIR